MSTEYPWPEEPERVESRLRGLVDSVVRPEELVELRLDWVTPYEHRYDLGKGGWIALRITVVAGQDETFRQEIWNPAWPISWESRLTQLAEGLEDWVCESRFAWGQQRTAHIPD